MERIVNGYYADPKSTRDIIGINPEEFEVLVAVLQEKYKQVDMLFGLPEDERIRLLFANINILKDNDTGVELKDFQEDFIEMGMPPILDYMARQQGIIYNFLTAINQPYSGATYPPPNS